MKETIQQFNHRLLLESEQLDKKHSDYHFNKNFLAELYKHGCGKPSRIPQTYNGLPLTFQILEKIYWDVVSRKKAHLSKIKESYPTHFENSFAKTFKKMSFLKFYQSFWIENRCFDIFIPRLMLIIEIDGGVHNDELKMKKDINSEKILKHIYKIATGRISNSDKNRFLHTIYSISKESKKVSSARIKSTMAKIFINTIANDCSLQEIQRYLGVYLSPKSDLYTSDLNCNGRK